MNKFIVTSTGAITTSEVKITSIQITPSGASWVVLINDTAGNAVISLTNNSPAAVFTKPLPAVGLTALTLTSITRIIIGTE